MLTRELVSWIKEDFAPGYARTKILGYIKRFQNEVFNDDLAQTIWLNPSDDSFPIPYLSTTEGTLQYTPSASNLVDSDGNAVSLAVNGYAVEIRRIRRIFQDVSELSTNYDNTFIGRQFDWAGINDNWSRKIYNVRYREVPATLYDKTDLMDAHLIFAEDPKTSTSKYYCEFFFGPAALDSESIPLSFDSDKFAEAIFRAVRGYMEESRNGRSELLDGHSRTGSVRGYWIPKIRASFNANATRRRPYMFATREAL